MHQTKRTIRDLIEEHMIPIPEAGCWLWLDDIDKQRILLYGTRTSVKELVYEAFKGPIPDGKIVIQSCQITDCVNPAHLLLVGRADREPIRQVAVISKSMK